MFQKLLIFLRVSKASLCASCILGLLHLYGWSSSSFSAPHRGHTGGWVSPFDVWNNLWWVGLHLCASFIYCTFFGLEVFSCRLQLLASLWCVKFVQSSENFLSDMFCMSVLGVCHGGSGMFLTCAFSHERICLFVVVLLGCRDMWNHYSVWTPHCHILDLKYVLYCCLDGVEEDPLHAFVLFFLFHSIV